LKAVAHAHGSPAVLLRVCLRSNLRREPGRWPGVFPHLAGKANSVSPVPARIALRGGERAGAVAICLSTPATKTCRRGPRLPLQEKSDSGSLSGQPTAPDLGNQRRQLQPDRAAPTPPPSRHTDKGVLAQPFNNSKKSVWGQISLPRPPEIRLLYSR
jgi:hypothetical protein